MIITRISGRVYLLFFTTKLTLLTKSCNIITYKVKSKCNSGLCVVAKHLLLRIKHHTQIYL